MTAARPDKWFTKKQMDRLSDLMAQWRDARGNGLTITQDMQAELESLVEAELLAAAMRSQANLDQNSRASNQ